MCPNPDSQYFSYGDASSSSDHSALEEDFPPTPTRSTAYDSISISAPYPYDDGSMLDSRLAAYHPHPQEQAKEFYLCGSSYIPPNYSPTSSSSPPNTDYSPQNQRYLDDTYATDGRYRSYSASSSAADLSYGVPAKKEQVNYEIPRGRYSGSREARMKRVATQKIVDASKRRRNHPAKFSCDICNNDFTTTFALGRHKISHSGQRNYPCQKSGCNKRFFTDSGRARHEKSPTLHK